MGAVFSAERGELGRESRVLRVDGVRKLVRMRSSPAWCWLHWLECSVLCAGESCPACGAGLPRRRYAFVSVDRPEHLLVVMQLTEGDLCKLRNLVPSCEDMIPIGAQFRVWRPRTRQPMAAEYVGLTTNLLATPVESLLVDLLRIHGIMATEGDVRGGGFPQMVRDRCALLLERGRP